MRLSVIIPVFNERITIKEIIDRVMRVQYAKQVIIIDDGSTDGTRDVLFQLREKYAETMHCLFHPRNLGKGAAIKTASGLAAEVYGGYGAKGG